MSETLTQRAPIVLRAQKTGSSRLWSCFEIGSNWFVVTASGECRQLVE